jgi:hypothetical protein
MINELIKDREDLVKQLTKEQLLIVKIQGAIEYIDKKIEEDNLKNKPVDTETVITSKG